MELRQCCLPIGALESWDEDRAGGSLRAAIGLVTECHILAAVVPTCLFKSKVVKEPGYSFKTLSR